MVLPVHDDNPTRRMPIVTYALILANVVVFLLSPLATSVTGGASAAQECRINSFLSQYAAIPDEVIQNRQEPQAITDRVVTDGQRSGCAVSRPTYKKVPFLSVLYAMFLHGGWLHLLGNMLFLYVLGNNVEDRLGRLTFLAFYLGCGYAATYGFSFLDRASTQPLVGASGAIAGVLGAYIVLYPRAKVLSLLTFLFFLPVRLPAWLVLGSWFVLQDPSFRESGFAGASGVAYGPRVAGCGVGAVRVDGADGLKGLRG